MMCLRCGASAGVSQLRHLQAPGAARGDSSRRLVQATADVMCQKTQLLNVCELISLPSALSSSFHT